MIFVINSEKIKKIFFITVLLGSALKTAISCLKPEAEYCRYFKIVGVGNH
jgi:hypothetical protein